MLSSFHHFIIVVNKANHTVAFGSCFEALQSKPFGVPQLATVPVPVEQSTPCKGELGAFVVFFHTF